MSSANIEDVSQARIAKVGRICKSILKLTPEDFEAVEEMARKQIQYIHPLKYATAHRINELGEHNQEVSRQLRELQAFIKKLKS